MVRVGNEGKEGEILSTRKVDEEMESWRRDDSNCWIDTGEVSGD
jgi:hypothetical protein